MKPLILALTTSQKQASLALMVGPGKVYFRNLPEKQSHAETLHQSLQEILDKAGCKLRDVELFGVDQGPGSFTGIRVGIGCVRAWAFALGRPVLVKDSFSIMREEIGLRSPEDRLVGLIDAHSGKVFLCEGDQISLVTRVDALNAVEKWSEGSSGQVVVYGETEFLRNLSKPNLVFSEVKFPKAEFLLAKASCSKSSEWTKDWKLVLPLYLRASAADENRASKSSTKKA